MSQEHVELRGSTAFELRRLDLILSELARPALDQDSMSTSTLDGLLRLGICDAGDAARKDLIERLWDRKRCLLRQTSALGDSGPYRPVA